MAVFMPYAALALGALGAVVAAVAWIKAMVRSRAWHAEPTAAEGAVAVSGALLFAWGVAVIVFGATVLRAKGEVQLPPTPWFLSGEPAVGSRSVSYSDPERQQALKDALSKAGIPYTLRHSDGKEFVAWKPEYDAAVDAIQRKLMEGPLPAGRAVHFPDSEHERKFLAWLDAKGIGHERVRVRGDDYIVWQEGAGNLMDQYMADRARDCAKRC